MRPGKLTQLLEDLVSRPGEQLGRGARFLVFQFTLWKHCAKRLHENNVVALSAALSFRTIFALIPALVLGFLVLNSIGVVEDGKAALRNFLHEAGFAQIAVPQSQAGESGGVDASGSSPNPPTEPGAVITVADQIEQLVAQVESKLTFERLGPVGAILLIWTALTLFTTLESALNRIFEAPRSRSTARRVLLFWTVITLGPILVVALSFLTSAGVNILASAFGGSGAAALIGWAVSIGLGLLAVTAAYRLIPNRQVRLSAALAGAAISVPLWLLARWAFAFYVRRYVVSGNLYGVLGAVPLFMLWLNVSWSIFLFGAQLAHLGTNVSQLRRADLAKRRPVGPSDWLAVMLAAARGFSQGDGRITRAQFAEQTDLPEEALDPLLDRLTEAGLLCSVRGDDDSRYLLAKSPDRIGLRELMSLADLGIAPRAAGNSPVRSTVTAYLEEVLSRTDSATLADLTARTA